MAPLVIHYHWKKIIFYSSWQNLPNCNVFSISFIYSTIIFCFQTVKIFEYIFFSLTPSFLRMFCTNKIAFLYNNSSSKNDVTFKAKGCFYLLLRTQSVVSMFTFNVSAVWQTWQRIITSMLRTKYFSIMQLSVTFNLLKVFDNI